MTSLGERLRAWRTARGLSQVKVAERDIERLINDGSEDHDAAPPERGAMDLDKIEKAARDALRYEPLHTESGWSVASYVEYFTKPLEGAFFVCVVKPSVVLELVALARQAARPPAMGGDLIRRALESADLICNIVQDFAHHADLRICSGGTCVYCIAMIEWPTIREALAMLAEGGRGGGEGAG